jgi:hypothetical protein
MHKLWEEDKNTIHLQSRLSLKIEQLRVNEEKTQAQASLLAVTKRRLK